MKKLIRKMFPSILALGVIHSFLNYYRSFIKHSAVINYKNYSKLLGVIIGDYHVIEKGLTMPNTRFNFGREKLQELISNCEIFIKKYGNENLQLKHALGVVLEYKKFHEISNKKIHKETLSRINSLILKNPQAKAKKQKQFKNDDFFSSSDQSFYKFAVSRSSARNYTEEKIDTKKLIKAVEASNNTPSSCNRQSTRVHIYKDTEKIKKILELQGGNRGFGHLANKVIIITSDLSLRHAVYEMSGPYVDGGMYAMSILYALHNLKIGACPLNCNFSPKKEKEMRTLCQIPKNEVFVVMISCGYLPSEFKIPFSQKHNICDIYKIHNI